MIRDVQMTATKNEIIRWEKHVDCRVWCETLQNSGPQTYQENILEAVANGRVMFNILAPEMYV